MVNIRLKTELLKQGISQVELAYRLDIDDGYLSNIIRGWKKPPKSLQNEIGTQLGKSPDWLFGKGAYRRRRA